MVIKLTIELVPKTAWYSNVRSNVTPFNWDLIRKNCYAKANNKCEICGGQGQEHPVECHEIWEYDDINKIQTLKGLIALCPNCHKVKHFGLSRMRGEEGICLTQLIRVNQITKNEALKYVNESFKIWEERNKYKWECNIDYLKMYNL